MTKEGRISLYYKDARGSIRVWSIFPSPNGYVTESGLLNGTISQVPHNVVLNESGRDFEDQRDLEIQSKINKQIDKGYRTTVEEASKGRPVNALGFHKPMLAQPFEKVKPEEIESDRFFLQRKYNGFRCVARKFDGVFYSRNGKPFDAIREIIESVGETHGIPLDGEIYSHGLHLNTISSLARKRQPGTQLLKYYVYDAIMDEPYSERLKFLKSLRFGPSVELVPTLEFDYFPDVRAFSEQFIREGYEGAIVRPDGFPYFDGVRSKTLLKVKQILDAEFKVVDILRSVDGWARLVCVTDDGQEFNCSAPGNFEQKTEVLKRKEEYIGKMVTVQFPEWTKYGKPSQPVAVRWRHEDEE